MIFIIGGNGLTGSAIVRRCQIADLEYRVLQRDNYKEFLGKRCDILVYANGNALKWKANQNPFFDFHASLATVAQYIHEIKYDTYVQLSTVDVYSDKTTLEGTAEDSPIQAESLDTYGFHKFLAEEYVRKFTGKKSLILRLPGLVGPGLQKNPVFDYIHPDKKVMISRQSRLNFIHTDSVAQILFTLIDKSMVGTFNVAASDSICIDDIAEITGVETEYTEDAKMHTQNYAINTAKLAGIVDLPDSKMAIRQYYNDL